jgi:hypothetical protein
MLANHSTSVQEISNRSKRGAVDDQRSNPRFQLTYAVALSRPREAFGVATKTENVSCGGFYCLSARPFWPGERLDFEMAIPDVGPSRFQANDLFLHGVVEVLRVMSRGIGKGFGLACRLERYTIGPKARKTLA